MSLPNLGRGQIVLLVKIAVLLVATLVFFGQDLTMIFTDALLSETSSHILAIPFILIYLLYRKRKILWAEIHFHYNLTKTESYLSNVAGAQLAVIAILLYWRGSHTFTPLEYHMVALPIFLAGLSIVLFNLPTLKELAFPIVFLLFLVPPPSELLYALGATLSVVSSEVSSVVASLIGISTQLVNEYGTPSIIVTRPDGTSISFIVDIACSGIYSVIGFLIFGAFIVYVARGRAWKRLLLLGFGLPIVYLLNILRITLILVIGYHFGEDMALHAFHLFGGWTLIFLGTFLLLIVSEKLIGAGIFGRPRDQCSRCNSGENLKMSCIACGRILKVGFYEPSASDLVKIGVLAMVTILAISVQVPVFALTQGLGVALDTPTGQKMSTEILPSIPGYNLSFYFRDTRFEAVAKQDMSALYLYTPDNQSECLLWVTVEVASTRSSLHSWEYCLITWPLGLGYQPKVSKIDLEEVQLFENPPIIGRYFVFQYKATDQIQTVLYWRETSRFAVNSSSEQKHVKISVIAYPETYEEIDIVKNRVTAVSMMIAAHWQPIKTWSGVALFLSQEADKLILASTVTLTAVVLVLLIRKRKEKAANSRTYKKFPEPYKKIVRAIMLADKEGIPTLSQIFNMYQQTEGKTIEKMALKANLEKIEKIGIVKQSIANHNDNPILAWKPELSLHGNAQIA